MEQHILNSKLSLFLSAVCLLLAILSWNLGYCIGLYCLLVVALLGGAAVFFFCLFLRQKRPISTQTMIWSSILSFVLILILVVAIFFFIAVTSGV